MDKNHASYSEKLSISISQMENIKKNIMNLSKDMDYIELLSHLSLINSLIPYPFTNAATDEEKTLQTFNENPSIQFLTGLILKDKNFNGRMPQAGEVEEIINLTNEYFLSFLIHLVLQRANKEEPSEVDRLILLTRLQKIVRQVTPNNYPFQMEEFIHDVFYKYEDFFQDTYGFTTKNAENFGKKIHERYKKLIIKRISEAEESKRNAKKELKMQKIGTEIRKMYKEKFGIEDDDIIVSNHYALVLYYLPQQIFIFKIEEFIKEEDIKEMKSFENYINRLSCKFGNENTTYECPLDDNIILTKPIINIDNKNYFCPSFHDLTKNLPLILENLLKKEKENYPSIWESYRNSKSKFVEKKSLSCLSKIFPKDKIHPNLKYYYEGKDRETDIICKYDNKIIITEIKSGKFSEPAQRGAIKSLKTDLKDLIEEAFEQGDITKKYIRSTKPVIFKDNKNHEIKIDYDPNIDDFILINVTFEPLLSLATGLKKLRSLGLFDKNEYPWSINIFDLEILTNHIEFPGVFIHYIENRLKALDEDIFFGTDELIFFAHYLKTGNLFTPLAKNGKNFQSILLDNSYLLEFEEYYLLGNKAPTLKIEVMWKKIIKLLENPKIIGHTKIISALLDVPHKHRERMIENIEKIIHKTKKDKEDHDYSEYLNDRINTGYTFMTTKDSSNSQEKLINYCILRKYQVKANRWVGIGLKLEEREYSINKIFYDEIPWEYDSELDKLNKKSV
jgi:hypothetical protein